MGASFVCPEVMFDASLGARLWQEASIRSSQVAYAWLGDDLEISQSLTYAQLYGQARRLADELLLTSVPGDRVLLAMDNSLECVLLFWACICAGLIPVPAPSPDNVRSRHDLIRLKNIASDAGVSQGWTLPSHLNHARDRIPELHWHALEPIGSEPVPESVASPPAAAGPDALAYLQYTSGSTRQPKGVEITHAQALAQVRALPSVPEASPPRSLVWLPWFHDYGLVHGIISPLVLGMTSYLMSTNRFLLNPLRWLESIDRYRITYSGGPNFAFAACVNALARKPSWTAQLGSWRLATCGAEPVRPATMQAFIKAFEPFGLDRTALAPSYGLAEAVLGVTMLTQAREPRTIWVDADRLEQGLVTEVPADHPRARAFTGSGPALPGFELRIVNPDTLRECEVGHTGEIWVAGPSVARGYWGQVEATRESFDWTLPDLDDPAYRFLRTGDLGFLAHGELFVAGRRKDLILVNGRNLHPQDLELTAQESHPAIRDGGVMAVAVESSASERVVLLVECRGLQDAQQARTVADAVAQHVGREHEIGVKDVVVLRSGSLPRTSSGKPMRSQARQMYLDGQLDDRRWGGAMTAAPSRSVEVVTSPQAEQIASIWCEVLGVPSVQPDDDFLDMGGDSLMATQLVSRLATRLGITVSIGAVFEVRTFGALLARLASTEGVSLSDVQGDDLMRPSANTVHALSFSQERMWFMHQLGPASSAYHIPFAIRLRGQVRHEAMQRALDQVVHRHDILRTVFVSTDQGAESRVLPPWEVALDDVGLPDGRDGLQACLAEFSQRPFDIAAGPLIRARLVRCASDEAVLIIVMHHLVSDQWSCALLAHELARGYSAAMGQPVPALPALTIQYADYANWHRRWFDAHRREQEMAYWSRQLEGLQPLTLNEDRPRPPQPSFHGASVRLPMAREDFNALTAWGARHGASLSMVLLAALNALLLRHTQSEDVAIGMPIANRNQLASEPLIGTFVNTLVLRTDLTGDPSMVNILERVRHNALEAFAHQDMPFELLVRELNLPHDPSRSPLFTVMFNMVNAPAPAIDFHGLEWSRVDFDRQATQFDLSVLVDPQYHPGIVFEYSTDLFERSTIERMCEHMQALLSAALQSPERPVRSIGLMAEPERDLLRRWTRGSETRIGFAHIGEWLAQGALQSSDRMALIDGDISHTHAGLRQRVADLSTRLRRSGIGPGSRVGVCMPRSAGLVIALLAVLDAGAAYVPLDPSFPAERLAYQVEDAGITALLAGEASMAFARGLFSGPVWDIDQAEWVPASGAPPEDKGWREPTASDPAYLIYTSGSTGQPKGVLVPHGAVLNFLISMASEPGLSPGDRLLAVTTVSFDIAVLELLLPLGTGATIVLASEEQASDGRALAALIQRHGVNTMQATPSRWHLLLEAGWPGAQGFKALVGGEPLDRALAHQLQMRCAQVWNMYGPTETTVWSTCWRVEADAASGISLGHPIANTTVHILDAALQPCPVGVMGEICIGGLGLALGYHNRPALTDERFVSATAEEGGPPVRLYRTGDRGRWRSDGSLEHGGRMDDQVKLRGFRIELGEIEARLATMPGVQRSVVALKDLPGQGPALVAYLVCDAGHPGVDALRRHLMPWLPDYMIPTQCQLMDALPLLANGKTNREALPLPSLSSASGRRIELPRNHAEQLVWNVWTEVLGTRELGIHDLFFDVGGHSLLAVRVAARLEHCLGRPVPLGLVFTHATIARCAEQLMMAGEVPDLPVAVLQPDGDGVPVFLLAGADMYRSLARAFAPDTPVYGLFSSTEIAILNLRADEPMPPISVRMLALEYVALIQSVQPHGPYVLGGFSIGGVIAHEVARLLQARGESVRLLVMLDCALPGRGVGHLLKGIRRRMRQVSARRWGELAEAWRTLRRLREHRHEPGERRIAAYTRAIREHQVNDRLHGVEVLFVQAGDDPCTEPAYGWPDLIPDLRIERLPGRHARILEQPNVSMVARWFKQALAGGGANANGQP